MNSEHRFRAYEELAWTERLLAPVEGYREEATRLMGMIREKTGEPVRQLLHLGCGAGGHDYIFKETASVTGVDLSEGMLALARENNPEVTYIQGDMRDSRLAKTFDAVVIPDSIGYMTTTADLKRVLVTASEHLRPGGILLIIACVRETFRENNFVYTGREGDIRITLFETNQIPQDVSDYYEATLFYLVRRGSHATTHQETHRIGLFTMATWETLFHETGFQVEVSKLEGYYDEFLMEEGEYPAHILLARRQDTVELSG